MENGRFHDYCFGCPLPRLIQSLNINRNRAQIANANIVSSESPTQAAVYQQDAISNVNNTRKVMEDIHQFVSTGKKCPNCSF